VFFYSSFAKKSVFYTFLQILPALAGIIILRIYSSLLTREEYAVLAMLTTTSTLSLIINSLCMDQVITRYYYDHVHDRKKLDEFFLSVISVMVALLFVIIAFVFIIPQGINEYLFKGMLENMQWQFIASVLVGFALSLYKSLLSFQRNEQAHFKVLILTLSASVLQVAFVWIGIRFFQNSVLGAQLGKFAGIALPTIVLIFMYFAGRKASIKFALIREVVPFFAPLVLYGLMYWGVSQFDQVLFQMRMQSLELLALYVMAFNIALFADLILSGLSSFIIPEMNMIMKQQTDTGRISNYIHLFVLMSCFSILAVSLAGNLMTDFYLDPKYGSIGWIIDGLLIGYIFRMLYTIYSFPVYYQKKTMILTIALGISLAISLSVNWFLIPSAGIFALLLSNFLSRFSQAWLTAGLARKMSTIPFNRMKVFGLTVIFVLLLLSLMIIGYFTRVNHYLAISAAFIIAVLTALILFRKQLPVLISLLRDGFLKNRHENLKH